MKYFRRKTQHLRQNFSFGFLAVGLFFPLPALAFASPGDFDLTFGSGVRVITRAPAPTPTPIPKQSPTLHANGKIAFTSDRDGNLEIYVMNPDGSNQVRITSNNVVDAAPTWSPDGRKIAFVSQKQNGSFAIFRMNADGTDRTEITALHDSYWAMWSWAMRRVLNWSPDGGRIAFHDAVEAAEAAIDIFVVNLDGSGRQNLTADHAHLDLTPTWSPDGSKILFSRYDLYDPPGYGGTMLHTINVDGTNLTRLANGFADGWNEDFPDWSPAANKIVYSVNRWDFVFDLYIANPDGTGRQFFHGCDWFDNSCRLDALTPAFSPDGTKIVFSMLDFDNNIPQKLYVKNLDGTGLTLLTNNGASPSWQPLVSAACPNPIDCPDFFIRQHYSDFLNREPDDAGLSFWTNEITSCAADAHCVEVKRINVSAAFFLSIEFQETGYLAYRFHKAAFGDTTSPGVPGTVPVIRRQEFLTDSQRIAQGVRVGIGDWQQLLEANKNAYALDFVGRQRFRDAYPSEMSAAEFVDALNARAGGALSPSERNQLVAELAANDTAAGRAVALRKVAEDLDLRSAEFNRAFVLMQYYGYLRRNPDDPQDVDFVGWKFWLDKLNQFNGDFVQAEMVKAFLQSAEYRQRFGQ